MDAKQIRGWDAQFERMIDSVGGCFSRQDLRRQAAGCVRGLLGQVERKNSWQLAEHLGREKPYGIQRLLGRASWNADHVRDELVRYAAAHLVTHDDLGVLIVDETGFLKKGNKSVGVQRQYGGTDRELSGRRFSGIGHIAGPGPDRSGIASAADLVR